MSNSNSESSLVPYGLVKAHLLISVVFVFVAVLGGMTYAMQFIDLYPFKAVEWFSPGRVRMVHTQAVAYAWIANAFFGIMYYMIPKLTNHRVLSEKLGWVVFYVYNVLILATVVLILAGFGQGLEWAETPRVLDPFIAIFVVLLVVNLVTPMWKARSKPFYVSVWYILAALIWTPLVYVMGNFLPEYVYPGSGGAAISSMYIHDLVGLFVTPIGTAMVYYLLPVLMKRPIFSHALSLIGFWGLAFFYPMNSTHHYLYSPIPMWSQYAGIIASVGVHIVVYTVVFNIVATIASDWKEAIKSTEIKFLFTGTICYLITCIQCAIQVTLSVQSIIHFTDWVVGHSHFVLFGVFSFWAFAWIYYLIPRLLNTAIYSESLKSWHFWLSTLGIFIMQFDLLSAGLVQGYMWKNLAPFIDTVAASMPFWWVRAFSGMLIFVAQVLLMINIYMTWKQSRDSAPANANLATAGA
ncbi:MAG: cbb3-type cytochrome c oxidase subunit I [Deltaproteobacteria bacterium]|nr:cbb3-type cytochrome c oxidase subunit I [Deltaproteobacteria bacterium]